MLRTCALQHKTLNQIRNSSKLLQATLYVCNNLFINCSLFDLASTYFTHCRNFFKKFVFLASPKTRVVTPGNRRSLRRKPSASHRRVHPRCRRKSRGRGQRQMSWPRRRERRWVPLPSNRAASRLTVTEPLGRRGPRCSSGLVSTKGDAARLEGSGPRHFSLLLG